MPDHPLDPGLVEAVARALCDPFDPDELVKPHPNATTQFAPYPLWHNNRAPAERAVRAVQLRDAATLDDLTRFDFDVRTDVMTACSDGEYVPYAAVFEALGLPGGAP